MSKGLFIKYEIEVLSENKYVENFSEKCKFKFQNELGNLSLLLNFTLI